jgi:sortase A
MRKLAIILIVAVIFAVLNPLGEWAYTQYRQQIFIDTLSVALQAGPQNTEAEETGFVRSMAAAGDKYLRSRIDVRPELSLAIGILIVEKIGLTVPLINGINPESLKIGVGILEGSAELDQVGNTILTAQRTHVQSRLLSRLDQLQPGDKLVIVTFDGKYDYIVYSNSVVSNEDVLFLAGEEGENTLTLFTGYPFSRINPDLRLVIKAK